MAKCAQQLLDESLEAFEYKNFKIPQEPQTFKEEFNIIYPIYKVKVG